MASHETASRTQAEPELTPGAEPLIALERVEKLYRLGKIEYRALRGVDLEISAGVRVRRWCPRRCASRSRT